MYTYYTLLLSLPETISLHAYINSVCRLHVHVYSIVACGTKMHVSVLLATTLFLYFSLPSDALPEESSPEVLLGQCPNDQVSVSISSDLRSVLREKVIPALSCSVLGACAAKPAASCKQIAEQRPDAPSGD